MSLLVIFYLRNNLVGFPLGPDKVVLVPLFEVAHGPPEALLQTVPHQDRVVAFSYIILIGGEAGFGEGNNGVVRLVNLVQELLVVLLFQFKILVLIFRVGEVLSKLLNLSADPIKGGHGSVLPWLLAVLFQRLFQFTVSIKTKRGALGLLSSNARRKSLLLKELLIHLPLNDHQ